MRADLLQAIALCAHGNAFLSSDEDKATEMLGSNSTFRTVYEVSFERHGPALKQSGALAVGTSPWFRRLRAEEVTYLRLVLKDYKLKQERNEPAQWGFITDGNVGVEFWRPDWAKRVRGYDDKTPFKVVYSSHRYDRWKIPQVGNPRKAEEQLVEALTYAIEFSESQFPASTRKALARCLELHSEADAETPAFPDLFPSTFSHHSLLLGNSALRCMLVLSSKLWTTTSLVEGGDIDRFDKVTDQFWRAIINAFETAVNTDQGSISGGVAQRFVS